MSRTDAPPDGGEQVAKYRIVDKKQFARFLVCVLLLAVLILGAVLAFRPVRQGIEEQLYPLGYRELIEKYSREHELPAALVCAVVKCESGFRPDAESSIGARGLMQLTEETCDWVRGRLGGEETFDDMYVPEQAIRYGTYLLSYLTDVFGGTPEVLAAYHAGMNQVHRWLDDPDYSSDGETLDHIPFGDTEHYVSKVTDTMEKYRELYDLT